MATPELFDKETDSDELMPSTAGENYKDLAADVAKILDETCVGSMFRLSSDEG